MIPANRNPGHVGPNVVGISAGYHDSACCVLQEGKLVAAIQEERLSRIKNDRSFPWRAFRSCLREARLTIADIDCIAYYEDPVQKLSRQVWMTTVGRADHARRAAVLDRMIEPPPESLVRDLLGFDGRIEIAAHHLSHAASAYYFSGYDEAAILTADGVGEWATTAYGAASGSTIDLFEQVDFPHSLGLFYSAITGYLGFEVNDGEYKVMGLAPYGTPMYADRIRRLIRVGARGQYELDLQYLGFLDEDCMYSPALVELLGQPPRAPESTIDQFHMDVARSAQFVLEEVLLQKLSWLHERVPSANLCMAGGVALNVVANGRYLREGPFRRLFVQPAAGDAGAAIGAAAVAHVRMTSSSPARPPLDHVYLGPRTSAHEVRQMMKASSATFEDFGDDETALLRRTVDYLAAGKVVGWCHGRMEFGPRALGNRSILADPRRPEMRDRINALVKQRESFRPFAPAVLAERAPAHFTLDHASPFMLEVCQVASPLMLPSITHVDGSARVQTVHRATNPRFAALLDEFERRTGCPILLNTSFNMRGEPIVCSAIDAILCFVRSGLDVLVLESVVLERSGIPPLWEVQAHHALKRADHAAVGHVVYTFL